MLPWYVFRSGDQAQWPVSELNTAFTGMGLGICDDFLSPDKAEQCREQINCAIPSENIFSALFTQHAFAAFALPLCSASHFYRAAGLNSFKLRLGALTNAEPKYADEPVRYWTDVRQALRTALQGYGPQGATLGTVVSYGGSAAVDDFRRVLEE